MKKRPDPPLSTITRPGERRAPTIGPDPIAWFWVPAVGLDIELPHDLRFTAGRAPDCAVVINHPGVSRLHVEVERDGNLLRVFNRSKNGVEYGGALYTVECETTTDNFLIKAGERMKLDQVEVFPLTPSMVEARRELAFCLGYAREAGVMERIAEAAAASSFAIVGPPGTPRYAVAEALMRASSRRDARRREVVRDQVPSDAEAIREVASRTMGGIVYVDGDVLGKLDAASRGELIQQVSDPKWNLVTLWSQERHEVKDDKATKPKDGKATKANEPPAPVPTLPTEVEMLRARMPALRVVAIPPIASRKDEEIVAMLDHQFAAMKVGVTTIQIDRDPARPNLRAVLRYDWPGNHHELALCAGYIAHALHGAGVEKIAEMLGTTHDGQPLTRQRLRGLIEKWGIVIKGAK